MIKQQSTGSPDLKTTATETSGIFALWIGYWQSHSLNDFIQTLVLIATLIGSILYILVMWKKLRSKRTNSDE